MTLSLLKWVMLCGPYLLPLAPSLCCLSLCPFFIVVFTTLLSLPFLCSYSFHKQKQRSILSPYGGSVILVSLLPKGGEWYQTSVCVSFGIFQSCLLNRKLLQFNSSIWIAFIRKRAKPVAWNCYLDLIVLVSWLRSCFPKWGSLNNFLDTKDHSLILREIHAWSKSKMERFPLL